MRLIFSAKYRPAWPIAEIDADDDKRLACAHGNVAHLYRRGEVLYKFWHLSEAVPYMQAVLMTFAVAAHSNENQAF